MSRSCACFCLCYGRIQTVSAELAVHFQDHNDRQNKGQHIRRREGIAHAVQAENRRQQDRLHRQKIDGRQQEAAPQAKDDGVADTAGISRLFAPRELDAKAQAPSRS